MAMSFISCIKFCMAKKKREIPIKHLQFNSVNPLSDWPVFIQATDRIVELLLYIL